VERLSADGDDDTDVREVHRHHTVANRRSQCHGTVLGRTGVYRRVGDRPSARGPSLPCPELRVTVRDCG
jgi:hypothetical protein